MKTGMGKWMCAAVLAACVVGPAAATDYYVSSVHPNRSDGNAGTSPSAPWATIDTVRQRWGSAIGAGDTIHLERGSQWNVTSTYEYWLIEQGGSAAGGYVTVRGDDYGAGNAPVLRRVGGGSQEPLIYISGGADYVEIRDFVLDGGRDVGAASVGIKIGSDRHTGLISNIRVRNMVLRKLGDGNGVYCSGIHMSANNNNTISDCLIEGNDISGFTAWGLNYYSDKTSVKRPNLVNNTVWRNNRVHDPSPNRFTTVNGGIHIMSGGTGNVFEYNYVDGPYDMGCVVVGNCANDETGLVIRHNVLRGNTVGYGILVVQDWDGAYVNIQADIYGNIVAGNKQPGFSMQSGNYFAATVRLYNNTFYDNDQRSAPDWGGAYNGGEIWLMVENAAVNLDVRNNMIVHRSHGGSQTPCLCRRNYDGALTQRNNLYWHTSGAAGPAVYNEGTLYTVANVRSFESTAQNADPLFENTAQLPTAVSSGAGADPDGLNVPAASPAVDRGLDLGAAFGNSIDNIARPAGAGWDIGAYEYASQSVAVPSPPSNLHIADE
jgi:hypothetical protein